MARVAVAIVNYNAGALLERCLAALLAQTRRADRILVVDNASEDESWRAAEGRPGVELIRPGRNLGFAAANNLASRAAFDCDLLALLNPDAVAEPGWLEALVQAAGKRADFAAFGSKMLWSANRALLDGTGDMYHVSGRVWRQDHHAPAGDADSGREIFSACGAAALYRHDAFRQAGGFDDEYFCYLEDVDLGFRLRLAGHRCLYVPGAVVVHEGGTSAGSHSDFAVYHGHRNLVWTWFRNMPSLLLLLYLPQHLLLNLASICWFAAHGRPRVILRAKRDALLGLGRIVRSRLSVQRSRRASVRDVWRPMARGLLRPYLVPLSRQGTS